MKEKKFKENISLFKLSLPFIFMAAINIIAPIINTLVVSLVKDGSAFVEGIGSASQISSLFSTIVTFATSGIGIIIGQQIGKKINLDKIRNSILTLLIVAFSFAFIIYAIAASLYPFILQAYLKPGTIQYSEALKYGELLSVCLIISTFTGTFGTSLNAYGFSILSSTAAIITIFADLSLTLIFVIVVKLGATGSALGTVLAQLINFAILFVLFTIKITKINFKNFYFDKTVTKKLFAISAPISGEKLNYAFSSMVLGIILAQAGYKFGLSSTTNPFLITHPNNPDSVSNMLNLSRSMILSFANIMTVTSIGLSIGAEIILSREIGALNFKKARSEIQKAFLFSIIFDLAISIGFFFLRGYVIDFFAIGDPEFYNNLEIKNTLTNLFFVPAILLIFLQCGRTANLIYLSAKRATGNLKLNTFYSIVLTWISVFIGFIFNYLLLSKNSNSLFYGINGIFIASMFDEISRGIVNISIWKFGRWEQKIKLANPEEITKNL